MLWKLLEDDRVRNHVKVVPQRLFNSYPGHDCISEGTFQDGDFMLHLAGDARQQGACLLSVAGVACQLLLSLPSAVNRLLQPQLVVLPSAVLLVLLLLASAACCTANWLSQYESCCGCSSIGRCISVRYPACLLQPVCAGLGKSHFDQYWAKRPRPPPPSSDVLQTNGPSPPALSSEN